MTKGVRRLSEAAAGEDEGNYEEDYYVSPYNIQFENFTDQKGWKTYLKGVADGKAPNSSIITSRNSFERTGKWVDDSKADFMEKAVVKIDTEAEKDMTYKPN